MLSRQAIISKLESETNFPDIAIPTSKYTQPDTYTMLQMDSERINMLRQELTDYTSIPDVIGQLPEETLQQWLRKRPQRNTFNDNTSTPNNMTTPHGNNNNHSQSRYNTNETYPYSNNTGHSSHTNNSTNNYSNHYSNNYNSSGGVSAASVLAGMDPTSVMGFQSMLRGHGKGVNSSDSSGHNQQKSAYGSYLNFRENENIGIPESILPLFSNDTNQQRGMLYGMRNPDSLYKCLLLLHDAVYIMNTKYKRDQDVMTLKTTLSNAAKINYDELNYDKLLAKGPGSANRLASAILKENHSGPDVLQYVADHYKKPIFVVNMAESKVWHYKCLANDDVNNTTGYVLIDYQGCYLPFYHAATHHMVTITPEIIKAAGYIEVNGQEEFYITRIYIDLSSKDSSNPNTNPNTIINISSTNDTSSTNDINVKHGSITLDPISKEKVSSLQTKAKKLGIDIKKDSDKKSGKRVNKLKNELWNDIALVLGIPNEK